MPSPTSRSEAADFILNGVGAGQDLIVQSANDYRGNVTKANWDGSLSGYYVHRAAAADCSVQFEGGLPSFTFQGNEEMGVGDASVVAERWQWRSDEMRIRRIARSAQAHADEWRRPNSPRQECRGRPTDGLL